MAKISRNQPCPCGSGKKYKHCCAKTESLADFRVNVMERETEQLIHRVYHRFATDWFKKVPVILKEVLGSSLEKLPGICQNIDNLFEQSLEGAESEILELLNEYILFDYCLPSGNTIFKQYFSKEERKLRPMVAEAATKWVNSYISVYEIISMDEEKGIFRDIFIGSEHKVDLRAAQAVLENISNGDLILTRCLEKGDWNEITGFLPIFSELKEELKSRIQHIKDEKGDNFEANAWPQFLKYYGHEVIVTAFELFEQAQQGIDIDEEAKTLEDKLSWTNDKYYEVAQAIRTQLLEGGYTLENVYVAITLWNRFCSKRNPRITKMETMLAAVEYFINQELGGSLTQKDIAAKYNISPTTVSARYREFYETIAEDLESTKG